MNNKCFVIMPFTVRDIHLTKYNGDSQHWTEVYKGLIIPALDKAGLICERDDDDVRSRLIIDTIWKKIEDADLILCDLSSGNPNTFLELGWALRADKKFILIKDDLTERYFDLNQYYTYEYPHSLQPTQLSKSITELTKIIKETIKDTHKNYSLMQKMNVKAKANEESNKGSFEIQLLNQILIEMNGLKKEKSISDNNDLLEVFRTYIRIETKEDLKKFLPNRTWKKANNFETLTFVDDKNCVYKNYITGGTSTATCNLGIQLHDMDLTWSYGDFTSNCKFNVDFTSFIELYNPSYIWTLAG